MPSIAQPSSNQVRFQILKLLSTEKLFDDDVVQCITNAVAHIDDVQQASSTAESPNDGEEVVGLLKRLSRTFADFQDQVATYLGKVKKVVATLPELNVENADKMDDEIKICEKHIILLKNIGIWSSAFADCTIYTTTPSEAELFTHVNALYTTLVMLPYLEQLKSSPTARLLKLQRPITRVHLRLQNIVSSYADLTDLLTFVQTTFAAAVTYVRVNAPQRLKQYVYMTRTTDLTRLAMELVFPPTPELRGSPPMQSPKLDERTSTWIDGLATGASSRSSSFSWMAGSTGYNLSIFTPDTVAMPSATIGVVVPLATPPRYIRRPSVVSQTHSSSLASVAEEHSDHSRSRSPSPSDNDNERRATHSDAEAAPSPADGDRTGHAAGPPLHRVATAPTPLVSMSPRSRKSSVGRRTHRPMMWFAPAAASGRKVQDVPAAPAPATAYTSLLTSALMAERAAHPSTPTFPFPIPSPGPTDSPIALEDHAHPEAGLENTPRASEGVRANASGSAFHSFDERAAEASLERTPTAGRRRGRIARQQTL